MPKRIGMKGDGMNYVFTPGENGNLQARPLNPKPVSNPLAYTPKVRAKVIPRKGRMVIAQALSDKSGY